MGTTDGNLVLEQWLAPLPKEEFFEQYLGQNTLYIPGESERFQQVLTASEFVEAVHSGAQANIEGLRFAARTEREKRGDHMRDFCDVARARDCWGSLEELADECTGGLTLVFNQLYQHVHKVERACREMLRNMGEYTGANAYFSPPRGKLGLGWHYDCWDVFVLQIAGSKVWNMYDGDDSLPVERVDFNTPEPAIPEDEIRQQLLTAGDVLYFPRGTWHRPVTGDELSLHLTVGVHRRPKLHLNTWLYHELSQRRHLREFFPLDPFAAPADQDREQELKKLFHDFSKEVRAVLDAPDALKKYRLFCLQSANKRMSASHPDSSGEPY